MKKLIARLMRSIFLRLLSFDSQVKVEVLLKFADSIQSLNPHYFKDFGEIHQMKLADKQFSENTQKRLLEMYGSLLIPEVQPPWQLKGKEVQVYSQNGEDGILLYLFSLIGVENRTSVNIGCGGWTSNTLNLIKNFGWKGFEIDGSEKAIEVTKSHYIRELKSSQLTRVEFMRKWITRENINDILEQTGIDQDFDLLSVDIDGNDYYIWEAITTFKPRLVVMEYNAFLGPDRSISVIYDDSFDRKKKHSSTWYMGASLKAFQKLGRRKGYELVGCESNGVNAFFVRKDLLNERIPTVSPEEAYYPHFQEMFRITPEQKEDLLNNMPYLEV